MDRRTGKAMPGFQQTVAFGATHAVCLTPTPACSLLALEPRGQDGRTKQHGTVDHSCVIHRPYTFNCYQQSLNSSGPPPRNPDFKSHVAQGASRQQVSLNCALKLVSIPHTARQQTQPFAIIFCSVSPVEMKMTSSEEQPASCCQEPS